MSISRKYFDKTARGEEVTQYTLTNHKGASVSVIDFGGIVTSIVVPDRDGKLADVNLGFDVVDTYDGKGGCMGALIGRVGNRIGGAAFDLEGRHYVLGKNDGENNLHGGPEGFSQRMWKAEPIEGRDGPDQPRRRSGLPRQAGRDRRLHLERRLRAGRPLHGRHRQAHPVQHDQPRLFQPAWRRS